MMSFARELDLTAPVPGTANCAWVTVGRRDGGREELRDKLVIVEGAEKELEERSLEEEIIDLVFLRHLCLTYP